MANWNFICNCLWKCLTTLSIIAKMTSLGRFTFLIISESMEPWSTYGTWVYITSGIVLSITIALFPKKRRGQKERCKALKEFVISITNEIKNLLHQSSSLLITARISSTKLWRWSQCLWWWLCISQIQGSRYIVMSQFDWLCDVCGCVMSPTSSNYWVDLDFINNNKEP